MSIIDKIHDMIEDLEDELEALRSAPINEETARKIKEIEAELHTYKFGRNPWKGLVKENPTRF